MFKPQPFQKSSFSKSRKRITINDLYPELTPEEQAEAEFFLLRYLEIVRRIFERTQKLTDSDHSGKF